MVGDDDQTVNVNVNVADTGSGGNGGNGNGGEDKVEICHNGQTLEVAPSALPAHYGHGDTLGPCPQVEVEPGTSEAPTGIGLGAPDPVTASFSDNPTANM